MTFSDSDWTREPASFTRPPDEQRVWKLAAAISLCCVAAAIAYYSIEQLLDSAQRNAALQRVGEAIRTPPLPAASGATAVAPAAAPAAASQPEVATPAVKSEAEVDAQQMRALEQEMKQRAQEAAQQAAAEAARRQERAWARFYQRPAQCDGNPTSAQMVECANHYIRARRQFEERYPPVKP